VDDHLGQELFWKEMTPKPAGSIVLTIVGSIIAVVSLVFIAVAWICYRRCQISRKRTKEIQIEDDQTNNGNVADSPSAVQQKVDDSSDSRSDTDKKAKRVEMAQQTHSSRTIVNKISAQLNTSSNDVSDLCEMYSFLSRGSSPKHGISLASISTEQSQEPMPSYTRIAANSFDEGEKNSYKQQEVSTGDVDTN
ncbi:unnamed protein product, partial [Lymnaea stagnalis]